MRHCWIVLGLIACGGGKGGGAGGAGAAVERNAEVSCGRAHDCRSSFPTSTGLTFEDLFRNTEAECIVSLTASFDPEAIQASVDAGRIIYNAGDADVCADAFEQLTCDELWSGFTGEPTVPTPPECDTAFVGTVEEGDTCVIEQDCADGNACIQTVCMNS